MPTSAFMDSINWRIFQSLKNDKDHITFEDYVKFLDLIMNGNIERRSELTFSLISNGKDYLTKNDMEEFVKEILNFSSHSHYSKK